MIRLFANGSGNQDSIPDRGIQKTQKMVLNAALLNTHHYKIRIKVKVQLSTEWSSVQPQHLAVLAIEKGAFKSSSIVSLFTFYFKYIYISSSSSYRAGSTDIPDPLSPLLPIVHRPRQVFRRTTCILT